MTNHAAPSYAHGTSTTPLLGETIGQNLARTVALHGDREALVVPAQGYRATYRALWEATSAVARGLMAIGVERGDRVGIWSPNRHEWVLVQYATARIGAVLVNINPAYRTAELEYALQRSAVSVLFLARSFRGADYPAMLAEVRAMAPELTHALVLDDDFGALLAGGERVSAAELAEREASLDPDDPINIQYTSGTTGFPKGATLSHHNVLNNGFFVGEALRLTALRPRLHPGALLPLLRHGDGQPRLHQPRRRHDHPGRGLRGAGRARDGAGRALHGALRRPHHVPRRAGSPPLRTTSTCARCAPASWRARPARWR